MKIADYFRITGGVIMIVLSAIYHWFWFAWGMMVLLWISDELIQYVRRKEENIKKNVVDDVFRKIEELKKMRGNNDSIKSTQNYSRN